MKIDIFRLNWIFIDTIIIILLVLLLLGVKIFKQTHRWRRSFANTEIKVYPKSSLKTIPKKKFPPKFYLVKNKLNKQRINSPVLVFVDDILISNFPIGLVEAFCTYGYNVVNISIKLKFLRNHILSKERFGTINCKEIHYILDTYKKNQLITTSNYFLITLNLSHFPYQEAYQDPRCQGIIAINPKCSSFSSKPIKNLLNSNDRLSRFYMIFSEKRYFFSKQDYKKFRKVLPIDKSNIKIVKNSRKSFKNNETILLSEILNILKNK